MGRQDHLKRAAGAAVAAGTAFAITATGAIPAVAADEHRVNPGDTVSALAVKYGTSVQRIVDANSLDSRARIYAGQTLTIPSVTASTSSKTSAAPTVTTSAKHTVSTGETVWALAQRYGTTVSAIVKANSLGSSAMIRIGQSLTIPGAAKASTATASTVSPAKATTASATHKVASGDTVSGLAVKYGTTVSAIVKANSLGSNAMIRIGQALTIPGTASSTAPASSTTPSTTTSSPKVTTASATHKVASGDTVSGLAVKYGTTVSAIVKANSLGSSAMIRIGQALTIPGAGKATLVSNTVTLATAENLDSFGAVASGLVGDSFAGRTYAAGTVGAANQNKATLNAISVPSRADMQSMVVAAAKRYGVDPALAQAVAYQESGFNMRAVSPANAIGVMQVIPSSGQWASDLVGRDLNLLNPVDNVEAGVAILKHLTRGGRDLDIAIAGYYQGERGVAKYGMYADTKQYVASVKAHMKRFA
ncbi:lytic transglycosylase domain-containing protein [Demequina sp. NBRC 110051]|uniref:lytic transglycosylase domain-containing protein n=1 Tax=Demequina sp. NBRC 110051 TaxID=1570340 RepID=UPI0013564E47|nr:lytic transglycosylase domain-containing protein [Demequina sp. NBRC 110051]